MATYSNEQVKFNGENLVIPHELQVILIAIGAVSGAAKDRPQLLKNHLDRLMQVAATSSASISGLPLCELASPPEPIQGGFDSNGNLRLECLHANPQHCWGLSGVKCGC
jgi:hypothetical protein